MRRFIICTAAILWTTGVQVPRTEARTPGSHSGDPFVGITFDSSNFEADMERGGLRLTLPYVCTTACGGKLRVTIKTISGKRRAQGTTTIRKHRAKRGVARLTLPLKASWSQADLAVVHFEYVHREGQRWVTGLGHLLDGPRLVILGQDRFITGTPAAVRILVLHRRSGRPFKGAKVTATLSGPRTRAQRIRGVTGARGTLRAVFSVPRTLIGHKARLTLEARTHAGRRSLKYEILVSSKAKVLLVTDKPIYQPGQTIHMRTLSMRVPAGEAVANRRVLFEVFDGRGNLVFRRSKTTDRFGIAHSRFRLADQVNQGQYRIRARLHLPGRQSATTAKKTVKVYTYRLPGFRIRTKLDKPYFRPGEAVSGEVYVWYVFGKPVRGGSIKIETTMRYGGTVSVARQTGTTNKWGAMRFRFQVPRKGSSARILGRTVLRIRVKEPGGEERHATASAPILRHPISITLVPESGALVPGIPQRVFVTTSLPNGAPVAARVVLKRAIAPKTRLGVIKTDRHGLGVLQLKPDGALRILAQAKDARGRTGRQVIALAAGSKSTALLVRPERSLYREGQTMRVTIRSGVAARIAYLDVIRAGQTLSTHEVTLRRGLGRVRIPVGNKARGLLLLAAYVIPKRGKPIQDTRLVYIQQSGDLQVTVTADKPVYRPGERATLRFQVNNAAGQPVQAALGVRIVDAAVAELAKTQPGRYRVFFRLEEKLLMGAGSVPAFNDDKLVFGPTRGAGFRWRERATAVLLAAASPAFRHSLSRNSDPAHLKRLGRLAARLARPVLLKMARRISRAARRQLRKGWAPCGFPEVTLETLLDKKLLKAMQVKDPWGTRIRLQVTEGKSHWFILTVHSNGFDQKRTTADDISVKTRFRVRPPRRPKTYACGKFGGWGGFGKGGGGGGGGGFGLGGGTFGDIFPGIGKPRRHFPEALYVNPALITDAQGRATITLRMADSITTWNVSALASTTDGRFGSTLGKIRVFTPFFIDLNPPMTWLRGDRITVPVAVHNHRRRTDRIRVTLMPANWYRLVSGARTRTVAVGPNRVVSVNFVIEARQVGRWPLSVKAHGTGVADATTRQVVVRPGGDRVVFSQARYLERPLAHRISVPANAIAGSSELTVQVSPGALAATVEGLDSLLRQPHGCFEQNSSTTYPNVMILQHLRGKRSAGRLRQRASKLVAKGYQQLVTYETPYGGFSLYGRSPADTTLTAYGLHEFLDMSAVYPVDPKLLLRTRNHLAGEQRPDGSWNATPSYFFGGTPTQADRYRATAYIAWALARAQRRNKKKSHTKTIANAQTYLTRVLPNIKSPYTLALVGQLLAERRPRSGRLRQLIGRLVALRVDHVRQSFWRLGAGRRTITGSRGKAATVETTALVTTLLLRTRRRLALTRRGLRYLAAAKAPGGGWGSTQATVLTLQALLAAQRVRGGSDARGTLSVLLDNKLLHQMHLTAKNIALVQRVALGAHLKSGSTHELRLVFRGRGSPMVQLRGAYHLPYGKAHRPASSGNQLRLDVRYKKAPSAKQWGRTRVLVTLCNPGKRTANLPLMDLGLPAGFKVGRRELESLVKRRVISRFEVRPGHLYLYLDKLAAGSTLRLGYRLRAKQPLRVTVPPSCVYEYYDARRRSYTPHATLSAGRLP